MYNPLVSEYKIDFIGNRLLQTFFGGIVLTEDQKEHSFCVQILLKLFIFIYPFIIGFIFNLIIQFDILDQLLSAITSGVISLVIIVFIHILAKRHTLVQIFPTPMDRKPSIASKKLICGVMPMASQKSKVTMALHSILSFCLLFLAVYQINLKVLLNNFKDEWFISIILYLMSWFSVIVSHCSLTMGPPPETATYSTIQSNDFISSVNRPIHVLLILFSLLLNTIAFNNQKLINTLCLILLSVCPFLWLFGVIPPVVALFEWAIERALVILFGGTPSHLILKSFLQLVISVTFLLIFWAVDRPVPFVFISSIFGFIMSCDIKTKFKFSEIRITSIIVFSLLLISIVLIDITIVLNDLNLKSINKWLIIVILILMTSVILSKYSQSVYLFFGIIRNPIYPKSSSGITVFQKYKQKSKNVILLMNILIQFSEYDLAQTAFLNLFIIYTIFKSFQSFAYLMSISN